MKPKTKKNFFLHCNLEDLLSLQLVVVRYGIAKWHEISGSMQDFKVQYTCTLAPMLIHLTSSTSL